MISSTYRFIFIHIPKTGGNSTQLTLLPYSDDRKLQTKSVQDGVNYFEIGGDVTPQKHAPISTYIKALGQEIASYQVVATARHPFDRALSHYFSPQRWFRGNEDGELQERQPTWDREQFLEDCNKLPQAVAYLAYQQRAITPNYILRYDHLQDDFQGLIDKLGLPENCGPLPHVNRSADTEGLKAEIAADTELRAEVERMFPLDMKLLQVAEQRAEALHATA